MPYAKNDSLNIYYEVEGKGIPVVLAHGLSMSLEDWREYGYVESLVDKFTVILVDSRGHGRSGKPHDAALTPGITLPWITLPSLTISTSIKPTL